MTRLVLVVSTVLVITVFGARTVAGSRYEAKLDVVPSVVPGDTVSVKLDVRPIQFDPGFRFTRAIFSMHFDSSALSLTNLTISDSLLNCGWSPPRFYMAMPGSDNCGSAQIQIILDADSTWFDTTCLSMNSVSVLFEFATKPDTALYGDTALVQFCWKSCDDNSLSSSQSDTVFIVDHVSDWRGHVLTDSMSSLPGLGGLDRECREALVLTGVPHLTGIDFCGGAVVFAEQSVPGEEGDVNLNGTPFDVDDLSLLGSYCLVGSPAFEVDSNLQLQASDIDQDGLPATVSDWVALRYRIVGEDSAPGWRLSPLARLSLLRGEYSTEVYIDADEPTNSFAVWLRASGEAVDSVDFAYACNTDAFEAFLTEVDDTLIRVAYSAGSVGYPAIAAGYQWLFTVYHAVGTFLEPTKVEASTNEPRLFTIDIATGIRDHSSETSFPSQFELAQNYPNPFNPGTSIRFSLSKPASWRLEIFDVVGRLVRRYEDRSSSGSVSIYWDGRSGDGGAVSSGIYFYRLTVGDRHMTKKMLLLR